MAKLLFFVVMLALICLQQSSAKPHHHHHKRHAHHHHKYKRGISETVGKKSDYYGEVGNDGPHSSDDTSQAFLDMSQPQGPMNPEEQHRLISKTSADLSHLSQKDMDDAYNYVNNNHFGNEPPPNEFENAAPIKPDATKQSSARSSMYSTPEDNYISPQSYEEGASPTSHFNEPVEPLNPNDFERSINLGEQSGTTQYSPNFNYAEAGFPDEDGSKKSAVPSDIDIPANATHKPGDHTHLTDTAIIHHHDNDSNYYGVSRYPPYITKDGKTVYGPPKNNNGASIPYPYPVQQPNQAGSSQQLQVAYPQVQQPAATTRPQNVAVPQNKPRNNTNPAESGSFSPYRYPVQQANQATNSQQSFPAIYPQPAVQQPVATTGQQNVGVLKNQTKPQASSAPSNPLTPTLTKIIPDITQLTSPGSNVGQYPILPITDGNRTSKENQLAIQKNEEMRYAVDPSTGQKLSGPENNVAKLVYPQQPVIAKVGGGADSTSNTQERHPTKPLSAYQYPVTLVNLGGDVQGNLDKESNKKVEQTSRVAPQQPAVFMVDDPRCKSYTLDICYQPWMKKHCPIMCSSKKDNAQSNIPSKVPVAMPGQQNTQAMTQASAPNKTLAAPQPITAKIPAQSQAPAVAWPPQAPVAANKNSVKIPVGPAQLQGDYNIANQTEAKQTTGNKTLAPGNTLVEGFLYVEKPTRANCTFNGGTYQIGQSFETDPCTACLCENNGVNCYAKPDCNKVSGTCQLPSFGGNSNGACCSIPFVYNGQPQYSCVLQPNQGYWCGTTLNYDQDRQWGNCGACIQPPCPPLTTVPPFTTSTISVSSTVGSTTPSITPGSTTPGTTPVSPTPSTTPGSSTPRTTPGSTTLSTTPGSTTQSTTPRSTTPNTTPGSTTPRTTPGTTTPPITRKPDIHCNPWTAWSNCSADCGFGIRIRYMDCFKNDQKETLNETKQCYLKDCEPVCNPWSNYTECSKTCGGGVQTHKRNCSITDNIHTDIIEVTASRACNLNPCPTEWSEWSEWSECSVSCGRGYQSRWRKGSWEDLGRIISVPQAESRVCNVKSCNLTQCSEWSAWGECSKTCGGGLQERQRTCEELDAVKIEKDSQVCNNISCEPPFCGEWSAFTECSASCDGGIKLRWRTCGGEYAEENVTCNEFPCSVLPNHTEWSSWSECSATCGQGIQYRTRNVTVFYNNTESYIAPETESRICNAGRACEETPNTVCSEWEEWSECSATCNGMQTKSRHCKNATHESDELQARPCNTFPCPEEKNCTGWSDWSECSQSCGGGARQRYRTCPNLEQDVETQICNTQPCPETKIPVPECIVAYLSFDQFDEENKIIFDEGPFQNHANYDGDTSFLTTNFSCGNATSINDGEIYFNGTTFKNIPKDGITIAVWVYADSLLHRQSLFSTIATGSTGDNYYLDLEAGKVRWIHTNLQGETLFAVVSDAVITDKDWAHIAVTYNSTTGIAKVFVNAKEISTTQGQGGPLVDLWDMFAGLAGPIYTERFHGLLDELYIYNCSLTAEQIREVANTCRKNTGDGCPSPLLGVCPPCDNCNVVTTPTPPPGSIDGGWSEWSAWGLCSETCGNGTRVKTRECNNPEPQNGGLDCFEQENFGNDTAEESCNAGECPINGGFCNWSDWTPCDKPCGLGNMTRTRECLCPKPRYGGLGCGNVTLDITTCSLQSCPIHGNFTNWSPWSPCSKTCGTGSQMRVRECTNPLPKYGGNDCRNLGDEEETQSCVNEVKCWEPANWSPWSMWSECSRSCGNGIQLRNRSCTEPPPMNGAPDCTGNATEAIECKIADCCNIPYKRLGCFKDLGQDPRPMPEMLFTDRNPDSKLYSGKPVHGLDFQGYVTDLICRCAKSALEKKYTHFSIQDFGQCLSGPQVKTTYNKNGVEPSFSYRPKPRPWTGCMDVDHDECEDDSLTCVGMEDTNFVYGLEDVTPINGNYTTWSDWSDCSQSHGNGTQHRTRTCTNPRPAFGGANCSVIGPNTDVKNCYTPPPGDCQWSSWSDYGNCSQPCGPGTQTRQRNVAVPASGGGEECVGESTSTRECEIKECPVDCGWSVWSIWTNCMVTCGEGTRTRQRNANNPAAAFGGKQCVGDDMEVQNCTSPLLCKIDGGYTPWSSWSTCTKSCDGGTKRRTRNCTNPEPQYGGLDCVSQQLGSPEETKECNTQCCQVNGTVSEWSLWGPCDVECGTGSRSKTRRCDNPAPRCNGFTCAENLMETETCKAAVECPIPGNWGNWGNWTGCSKSCGFGGFQVRERQCDNPPPQFNGDNCFGNPEEVRNCDAELSCCTTPYANLGCYNDLSSTPSSKPLPQLLFDDQDTIDFENWDDVLDELVCKCAKKALELQYTHFAIQALGQCYSGPDVASTYDRYGASTNCVTTGGEPSKKDFQNCTGISKPCAGLDNTNYVYGLEVPPRHGNYSEWSKWGNCSVACGQGSQTRYRTCTNPTPAFGGRTCLEQNLGEAEETSICNKDPCPIDCGWTNWTDWSQCSTTCGEGISERSRSPTNPAAGHGGKNCTGESKQTQQCNGPCCPVAGNYSEWEQWGSWSKTCNNATRVRRRSCSNPAPMCGGPPCVGAYEDVQAQFLGECLVDGGWCEWSTWNSCSKTCGLGDTTRARVCECPPVNGGNPCQGPSEECKECNVSGCVVDGKYSLWTSWTACDRTCGNGTRSRSRSCSHPAPAFGGMSCIQQNLGESEETMFCKLQNCPVDGGWSSWSQWSDCSLPCGEGRSKRDRKCSNPAPLDGGANCDGVWIEERLCKMNECCDLEHESLGCYQDMQTGTRAFSEMLFTREDKIGAKRWDQILPEVICSCANATKLKGYTHFGITKYTQCWSGPKVQDHYSEHGESNQCVSMIPLLGGNEVRDDVTSLYPAPNADMYEPCLNGSLQCAGPTGSFYVYGVNPKTEGDGGYGEWSEWESCSRTCGGGLQTASRSCNNPFPKYGGNDCSSLGEATKIQSCNEVPCAVHGNWAGWTQWSSCSVTCGTGVIERIRNCSNPAPSENGRLCSTGVNGSEALTMKETSACNMPACPVSPSTAAAIAQWSEWSVCSVTCGNGQKMRERDACPRFETQGCHLGECPIDGAWGQWSSYTQCSKTCQRGTQNRTRVCDSPAPRNGGKDCAGVSAMDRECNKDVPCPVNGNYTEWSEWGACDVTCGVGRRVRSRTCTNPSPANGGLTCIDQQLGNATETEQCTQPDCEVPCLWGAWSEWDNCSVSSGYGTQMRFREVLEGNCTTGDANQTKNCLVNTCSVPFQRLDCFQDKGVPHPLPIVLFNFSDTAHNRYGDWNSYLSELVCECATKTKEAKYSHFALQDLGVCMSGPSVAETYKKDGTSTNCVSRISEPPSTTNNSYLQCQSDDLYCAGAEETSIFVYGLNVTAVDCGYSQWSAWDACSKTCGDGVSTSTRFDNNPPAAFSGKPCTEDLQKTKTCQIKPCPVPGNWGEWSSFGQCSITCGPNGTRTRQRECNNPPPRNDGAYCVGDAVQNSTCDMGPCPVDGGWSEWSLWGSCSKTCNTGTREHTRVCDNPAPVGTGAPCIGPKAESEHCNTDPCINPNGPWSNWTECNVTCGIGYRSRSRNCPIPPCVGDLIETATCDTHIPCLHECNEAIDLGFVVDFSNNARGYFRDFTKPFILKAASFFDISADKTHFAYLPYSTVPGTNLQDNLFKNSIIDSLPAGDKASQKDYLSFIVGEEIPVDGVTMGHTFVNLALQAAADHMFTAENGMRENVKHVLILISDGTQSTSGTQQETVKQAADAVRAKGVEIITIAVGSNVNENNLKDISNNDPTYVLRVDDYSNINSAIPAILNLSCVAVSARWGEWSAWSECSASCGGGVTYRMRLCVGGNPGDGLCTPATANNETKSCNEAPCLAACEVAIDLGFLVDYSGSVENAKEEAAIKSLIIDSAMTFDISKDNTHVGFIPFSTYPYNDKKNMFNNSVVANIAAGDKTAQLNYLNEIVKPDPEPLPDDMYIRGLTNTGRAAKLANDTMFTEAWGMRSNVKKYLVMVSDGQENRMSPSQSYFDAIKNKGVDVIVVAVGTSLKWSTLTGYASKSSNIFNFTSYDAVKEKMNDIAKSICPTATPTPAEAKWGPWSEWSTCTVTCGGGQMYRTRQCEGGNPGDGSCTPASANNETKSCNEAPCDSALPKCEATVDLGYIVDFSGSIQDTNDIQKIEALVKDTAKTFDISKDNTHFAYIAFSTRPSDNPDQWFNNSIVANIAAGDKAAQAAYLDQVVKPDENDGNRFSNTFRATKLASEKMFNAAWGMRQDKPKYLMIISDGKENIASPEPAETYLRPIKALGVEIIVVAVGASLDQDKIQSYATKPENIFTFANYELVKARMVDIAKSLCPQDDIIIDNPTAQDAPIISTAPTPSTSPTPSTTLEQPFHCHRAIDIVLLVDGSSSIIPYWLDVKSFLKKLVKRFNVNGTETNIAIILYSSTPQRELDLNGNQGLVEAVIDMMKPLTGGTRIDLALEFVSEQILAPGHSDRPDVPDVVVLLTDGESDKGSGNLTAAAQRLKDHDVHVVSVGLGNQTNIEELKNIANHDGSVFLVQDYGAIANYVDELAAEICEGINPEYGNTIVEHTGYTCEPTLVYSFDTVCDRSVYDESGKGNNGNAIGEFNFDETTSKCKAKMMVSQDGALVINGGEVRGKPVDGVTIATWLNLFGDGKVHPVFSVINSKGQGQYLLEVRPQGSVHFSIKFGDKVVCQVTTSNDVFKFIEWTHLAATYSVIDNKAVIYINGKPLEANKIQSTKDRQSELLPGDWDGFVAIGKEKLNSIDKQLAGGVDEFYMFPCVLQEGDIEKIKDFCSRYEPRVRSYAGTKYELFERPSTSNVGDLQKEIASKNATIVRYLDLFEAPLFDEKANTAIGTGSFAARLSGYFVPPISAEYVLEITSNEQGALYMDAEKPSLQSEVKSQVTTSSKAKQEASKSYSIRLKAGVHYYIELYQLSKEKNSILKLGFDVKCQKSKSNVFSENPITKFNVVHDIPRNCSEVHSNIKNAPDDEYTLRLHSKCHTVNVFCRNMAGTDPKNSNLEYLTLNKGPEENYGKFYRPRLVNFNSCSGPETATPPETEKNWGTTWFKRIRVNPSNMAIQRDDYTYAVTVGNKMAYGSAGDCYSKSKQDCRKGQFKINLNGTDMKIQGNPTWIAGGTPANMKERITQFKNNDGKVLSAHCGGSCSKCQPQGHLRLQPDICLSDGDSSSGTKNIKKQKRNKRSVWSWLPW
ncbi:uncharacterized protein LOC130641387 isoform X2 [Hydractinia symbiolongicarpus]|uniref:uncharacterized protein LOC130641387 isoform X2 n=1 Tax=Hydractinia symbiolongicarpus TaxID=13093 RepID=UPI00254CE9BB|nr:uncharacterized protein LOC130641387 isoform X2 [Hydractinia symbiolongicarpus]